MFGFQTLTCLHDIPVVRSSTTKLQDVYAKAKDTSVFIRFPCNVAETIADKSLKIACTVANPLVKPLRGPVRVIDDFAVQKLREMEAKYPVLTSSTDEVMNTFNEKTEPVRNVMNSVKDTTTSSIQHGKETVSNVATATVNKATDVADTVYTFCETHVPGKTVPVQRHDFGRRTTLLWERIKSVISLPINYLLIWFRMLIVSFLLKVKQSNDLLLNKIQRKPLIQRLLIHTGALLEYVIARIHPNNRTERKQHQPRLGTPKQFVSRQTLKPGALTTTRQSVVVTKEDTTITRNGITKTLVDKEELYPRLNTNDIQQTESNSNHDINQLLERVNPTDVERLYSRLPVDTLPIMDNLEDLTEDQRMLHVQLLANELQKQGYGEALEDYSD